MFLKWLLKRQILKERRRQVNVYGYTSEHDDHELEVNSNHLMDEAFLHYQWGHPIQALALLQAQVDAKARWSKRNRPDVSNVGNGAK